MLLVYFLSAVPLEVYNLNIHTVNGTSVNLTWSAPRDDGGFNRSTRYTVECYLCIIESKCDTMVKNAIFFPAKTNLTTTSVIVSNLMLNEIYKFKVISMNSLKNVPGGKWKFREKLYKGLNRKCSFVQVYNLKRYCDTNVMSI